MYSVCRILFKRTQADLFVSWLHGCMALSQGTELTCKVATITKTKTFNWKNKIITVKPIPVVCFTHYSLKVLSYIHYCRFQSKHAFTCWWHCRHQDPGERSHQHPLKLYLPFKKTPSLRLGITLEKKSFEDVLYYKAKS